MKKNNLVFGLIAGTIISIVMLFSAAQCYTNSEWKPTAVPGYASMVIAFSLIFVSVRTFRDKYNGGVISFKTAFLKGLYITLIASAVYVIVWLIDYYVFIPDFMDKYCDYLLEDATAKGADLTETMDDIKMYKDLYRNPFFVVIMTFMEVFPVGLVISLISALILKRKSPSIPTPLNL